MLSQKKPDRITNPERYSSPRGYKRHLIPIAISTLNIIRNKCRSLVLNLQHIEFWVPLLICTWHNGSSDSNQFVCIEILPDTKMQNCPHPWCSWPSRLVSDQIIHPCLALIPQGLCKVCSQAHCLQIFARIGRCWCAATQNGWQPWSHDVKMTKHKGLSDFTNIVAGRNELE